MRVKPLAIIGVPSSAGTHHAGQDLTPDALRAAGLVDRLREGGLTVEDRGDLPRRVFVADDISSTARSLDAVVAVASSVADAVSDAVADGLVPLVLGGDCTITVGVLAGVQRRDPTAGLLYLDGDADLATPQTTGSGVLDAMVIAHVLGLAGTDLGRLDGNEPMLTDDRLALIGYDESDPETHVRSVLDAHPRLVRFTDRQLRDDPTRCATEAITAVTRAATSVVVHFDVDTVDSRDLPLANFPHYGTGVPLAVAGEALRVLCNVDTLAAIVLTEVNPSYDPSGVQLDRYVTTVATAICCR